MANLLDLRVFEDGSELPEDPGAIEQPAACGADDRKVVARAVLPGKAHADQGVLHRAQANGLGIEGEALLLLEQIEEDFELLVRVHAFVVAVVAGLKRRAFGCGYLRLRLCFAEKRFAEVRGFRRRRSGCGRCRAVPFDALEQRGQAEFLQVLLEAVEIDAGKAAGFGIEVEIHVLLQGDKLAGDVEAPAEALEVFPHLRRQLVEVLENLGRRSIFPDQLRRRLLADAGDARNVVDGIAHEGLDFDRFIGAVTDFLFQLLRINHLIALHIVHEGAVVEHLAQVLVLGDHEDLVPPSHPTVLIAKAPGHGGDQVIGLEAPLLKDRDAAVANDAEDALFLGEEIARPLLPRRLIVRRDLLAEDLLVAAIDDHGQIVRLALLDQAQEHLGEDVGGLDRLAGGAGEVAKGGEVAR